MFTQSPISPQHLCCHVILSYPLILPTRGEICSARDNNNNVVCAGAEIARMTITVTRSLELATRVRDVSRSAQHHFSQEILV